LCRDRSLLSLLSDGISLHFPGAIRETHGDEVHTDYTIWTSAADATNSKYYYKTYLTQAVEGIDVRAALASIKEPTTLVMESGFAIKDRTGDF
jgi:choloylglycine hydrolase